MTARMRGNMTGNAGEFSTFLKELVNTGYIKISTGPGTWKRISLGRPHLYQYSVRRSKFFETESYTCQFCLWFHEHELSCWYGKCHHNGDERPPIHVIQKNT